MTRCVALLRGIGPTNPNMRNDKLCAVVEDLGMQRVSGVISSGNVVFSTTSRNMGRLEARMEDAWRSQLGFDSTTIIRTEDELTALVASDPFAGLEDARSSQFNVSFLKHDAEPPFDIPLEEDGLRIIARHGRSLCSVVDLSIAGTPGLMSRLDRDFAKAVTTRTWKTVDRIRRHFDSM